MAEPTAISPLPADDPDLWNGIGIAKITFPSVPGRGHVSEVKVTNKAKVQKPQASGGTPTVKVVGAEPIEGSFKVTGYGTEGWREARELMRFILPHGPNGKQSFQTRHPELNDRYVNAIVVEEVSETTLFPGGRGGSYTVKFSGWTQPAQAAKGTGVATPKQAQKWVEAPTVPNPTHKIGSNNNTVGGMDGPNGPQATP